MRTFIPKRQTGKKSLDFEGIFIGNNYRSATIYKSPAKPSACWEKLPYLRCVRRFDSHLLFWRSTLETESTSFNAIVLLILGNSNAIVRSWTWPWTHGTHRCFFTGHPLGFLLRGTVKGLVRIDLLAGKSVVAVLRNQTWMNHKITIKRALSTYNRSCWVVSFPI